MVRITSEMKAQLKQRSIREAKEFVVVFVYLAMLLGGFAAYRKLVLAEYDISSFHYGYSLFEALVLAKVIMIGRMLRVGERFEGRPLIIPTLYKAVTFSILILAFAYLEDVIVGLLHGATLLTSLREAWNQRMGNILARAIMAVVALIPLFAIREMARVLGEERLFRLFFRGQETKTGTA